MTLVVRAYYIEMFTLKVTATALCNTMRSLVSNNMVAAAECTHGIWQQVSLL